VTCRVLKIAKQPFYRWLKSPVSDRDWADAQLTNAAIEIHKDDPVFGYRFIADELEDLGFELPWVWFLVFFEGGGCRLGGFEVSVVAGLDFCGGAVAELVVQPLVVEPPHPFQGRQLDLFDGAPGSALTDQLGVL
jgi:hypothetical protein